VLKDNTAAVKAYEKVGFRFAVTPHFPHTTEQIASMVWEP
jgi:hypothetical protein